MNILVIEDERPLALALNRILTHAGWHVSWMKDGETGYQAALTNQFDAIVLDVLLPKKSGWDICAELRAAKVNTPILMLSALDEPDDKVRGLELGADDYLAKPFETAELVARVKSLLRREHTNKGQVMRVADLEIDRRERKVSRHGKDIALSGAEYDLLETLAVNEGRVVSRDSLLEAILARGETLLSNLDAFVASLQTKLGHPGGSLIHGAATVGYVLRAEGR